MAHCNTSSNNTQSITSSSHTSSINLPSNNKGVTFRAMPTPFFSVTNLYHALPSLPHCYTFKHLNYNLTTYTPHLHFTPYYTRCTYSYLTPYTPFLYDILYSFNIHTLIHTTQLLTAPLAGPINMIKYTPQHPPPGTSSTLHNTQILQGMVCSFTNFQHHHSYFPLL